MTIMDKACYERGCACYDSRDGEEGVEAVAKREPLMAWKPIETAPKDTEVLLYCNKFIPLYIGKKRYGCFGEPQQNEFEWRCSSSGRFANPTYWMPLPKSPIEAAHGIKEKNT